MDLLNLRKFETLSPFEIKDELIKLAKKTSKTTQSAFLNAGRGNPNWIATTPREGFFLLGQFALTERTRVMKHPAGLGGMPQSQGIAGRLAQWLTTDAVMPVFTPYIEMTHLEDYALNVVTIEAPQGNRFQFTDAELKKLEHPQIKAFFLVNPGNPTGVALSKDTIGKIANLVKTSRPDLMLLTDDVYGTFVPDFRSLLGELPHNTIGVYSYSKYFGCTGWRLGAIAIHESNIFDRMIAKLPDAELRALDKRYGALTLEPRKVKFIDRIVADSRDVALNHTAGLSLPQQVMMSLFSLAEMMDGAKRYQNACAEIVRRRALAMIEGLGIEVTPNPLYDAYYGLIDFEFWARKNIGEDAVQYLKKNVHPLDLAFRLAEDHGIVLLNGGGFEAPDWSLRVSLANLADDVYDDIGRGVRTVARGYRDAFEASKRAKRE